MQDLRTEHDLLGSISLPGSALYGIHTARAVENFPLSGQRVNPALIHAYGAVKLACMLTNRALGFGVPETAGAMEQACREMMAGELDSHILVDALQGGAGTSLNMNVNEVLANRALQLLDRSPGDYRHVSPIRDINRHQSTNDTFPTALKVAAIHRIRDLERSIVLLMEGFQQKEKEFAEVVKIGRTQMQDAVLVTLGREMGAYAETLGRDRWRVYKCEERLRVVNLGGTAVGTGLAAPRQYIFRVVDTLREITGLGLARAENLLDATQNTDVFVEVSGILKACAVNLLKIAGDLRFMASGPHAGIGELVLPQRQAGSSIMPGKVNPVIPEAVTQAAMTVMTNDSLLAHAAGAGNLELNPFMPLIAHSLLNSLDLLDRACAIFYRFCVRDLAANTARCRQNVETATATLTALVDSFGYETVQSIAATAAQSGKSIRQELQDRGLMTAKEFDEAVSPERVSRLGHPMPRSGPAPHPQSPDPSED